VSDTGEAPCPVQPFSESSDSTEQVKKSNCSGYQPPFAAKKTQKYILNGNRFEVCGLKKGTYYIRVKAYYSKKGKRYESGYTSKRKIKIKK